MKISKFQIITTFMLVIVYTNLYSRTVHTFGDSTMSNYILPQQNYVVGVCILEIFSKET